MNAMPKLFEHQSVESVSTKDGLFLERLETFMEKCLSDIKAFAERELQPYEETRRCIAQWHAKYLLQPPTTTSSISSSATPTSGLNPTERSEQVRSVLCGTSRVLESLAETSGVQSFLLAIDPHDTSDGGFLGGSLLGREFWRGFRGGGESGARSFKTHCTTVLPKLETHVPTSEANTSTIGQGHAFRPSVLNPGSAKSLKNDLYEVVRNALRSVSGIRNAEMKWTNPERLDVFGVRLVGWPEGVPAQNPSTLKVGQNRILLEAMQSGTMYFERLSYGSPAVSRVNAEDDGDADDPNDDFSWAYDADASISVPGEGRRTPSPSSKNVETIAQAPKSDVGQTRENDDQDTSWTMASGMIGNDTSYTTDYTWDSGIHRSTDTYARDGDGWMGESHLESERPRKRPRSEDPSNAMDPA